MKKGFTLLELSIVLVIIGLIIGGIVAGQELIRSSQLSRIVSDTTKLEATMGNFYLKYGSLPGDLENAYDYWGATCGTDTSGTSASCNGDGSGIFNGFNEVVEFAHHLSLAGMIPGNYTGTYGAGTVADPYYTDELVETELDGVFRPWYTTTKVHNKNKTNYWIISALSSVGNTGVGFLTPAEAISVDQKLDDGVIDGGSLYISGCTAGTATEPTIDLSGTSRSCWMAYWLD